MAHVVVTSSGTLETCCIQRDTIWCILDHLCVLSVLFSCGVAMVRRLSQQKDIKAARQVPHVHGRRFHHKLSGNPAVIAQWGGLLAGHNAEGIAYSSATQLQPCWSGLCIQLMLLWGFVSQWCVTACMSAVLWCWTVCSTCHGVAAPCV